MRNHSLPQISQCPIARAREHSQIISLQVSAIVDGKGLDLLINNAAIFQSLALDGDVNKATFLESFDVNCFGPLLVSNVSFYAEPQSNRKKYESLKWIIKNAHFSELQAACNTDIDSRSSTVCSSERPNSMDRRRLPTFLPDSEHSLRQ